MNSWRQPAEILPVMTGTVQEIKLGEAQTGRQGQIPGKESDNGLTFWEGSLFPSPPPPPQEPACHWGLAWCSWVVFTPWTQQSRVAAEPTEVSRSSKCRSQSTSESHHWAWLDHPHPFCVHTSLQSLGRKV